LIVKRAERLLMLKHAADLLAELEWSELDMTLRTFGFHTTDLWGGASGDKYAYACEMLGSGSDEDLVELHEYVTEPRAVSPLSDRTEWRDGHVRLFITHLASEKQFASQIKTGLEEQGIDGFVAHEDIEPTKEWENVIRLRLSTCHALCALLHPGFHASHWTNQEIGYALGRRILTFSVRLGQDPQGFLSRYQAIAGLGESSHVIAGRISDVLAEEKTTRAVLGQALVQTLVGSRSFNQSNLIAKRIDQLCRQGWTLESEHLDQLRQASKVNRQIAESFEAPVLIRRWISEHSKPA
jgi:hypothetical protein